jgi:hypothetical protein
LPVLYVIYKRKKIAFYPAIFAFVILGFYNSYKFLPFTPTKNILPTNAVIQALQTYTHDARFFGLGSAGLAADFATYYHIYDPNYYDPLHNKEYAELIEYANSESIHSLTRSDVAIMNTVKLDDRASLRRNRLFELLSVKYLLYKKGELTNKLQEAIWENDQWVLVHNHDALPRAYAVNDVLGMNDKHQLLSLLFSQEFDPKKQVLLENSIPINPSLNTKSKTTIRSYKEDEVVIDVNTDSDTMIVVTDTYYPGWQAFVDGQETKIYRANYALRALVAPKGIHTIVMKYNPFSFRLGVFMSLGFVSLYILYVWYFLRNSTN